MPLLFSPNTGMSTPYPLLCSALCRPGTGFPSIPARVFWYRSPCVARKIGNESFGSSQSRV